ncbi:S9 family peptidase [Candidatus Sneabacter namystus]|uniref:S9 family peptidase n=1 Tax=Candidatus Sneabacter namystus TaxID=2601646 RepID=A0A5C0UIE5_9RICK|nr:S9 family peptidase [Candidatus Sneabacter namystus]QEK39559.1 S9 family peptidase [Candidatus Sneabacter namystus]
MSQNFPIVMKKLTRTECFGYEILDEYCWMRDKAWPNNIVTEPDIIEHLNRENEYSEAYLTQWQKQRNSIFSELKGRIVQEYTTPPVRKDNYYYFTRYEQGQDYQIFLRSHIDSPTKEEVLLDVNVLSENHNFISVGCITVSPDHKYLAYSVDYKGDEHYSIEVIDLDTQEHVSCTINDSAGNIVWSADSKGFCYDKLNEQSKSDKIYYHFLFKNEDDYLLLTELDGRFFVYVTHSSDRKYIFFVVSGANSNEWYFIPSDDVTTAPVLIRQRERDVEYYVDHRKGKFYIRTNDQDRNFRLAQVSVEDVCNVDMWTNYIEDTSLYMDEFDVTESFIVLKYLDKGVPLIRVVACDSGAVNTINFPDPAYYASAYSVNYFLNDIRVSYNSLSTPATTFSYDFSKNQLTLLQVLNPPSGFDSNNYVIERVEVKVRDGTLVPMTIFFKKGFEKDGSYPLYLTAYGSYGIARDPSFSNTAISIVDRGFVYAIAHVRGGGELGYDWHNEGRFLQKHNTFYDFIDCTEYMIRSRYTSIGRIAIEGGSAGGMLVGAVVNMRPDLYKCAVANVPFVDVLNTMLDPSLPLTQIEYEEWGNPQEEKYFHYIKSYCPVQNVVQQSYPSIFAITSMQDLRVGYWEAAKWVAKLRQYNTSDNIIMLKCNMDAGHFGSSGRFKIWQEVSDSLVFIFSHLLHKFS